MSAVKPTWSEDIGVSVAVRQRGPGLRQRKRPSVASLVEGRPILSILASLKHHVSAVKLSGEDENQFDSAQETQCIRRLAGRIAKRSKRA